MPLSSVVISTVPTVLLVSQFEPSLFFKPSLHCHQNDLFRTQIRYLITSLWLKFFSDSIAFKMKPKPWSLLYKLLFVILSLLDIQGSFLRHSRVLVNTTHFLQPLSLWRWWWALSIFFLIWPTSTWHIGCHFGKPSLTSSTELGPLFWVLWGFCASVH